MPASASLSGSVDRPRGPARADDRTRIFRVLTQVPTQQGESSAPLIPSRIVHSCGIGSGQAPAALSGLSELGVSQGGSPCSVGRASHPRTHSFPCRGAKRS
ncbi:hypothetical protein VTI28DRAFT_83 [Corynascus sepedonium]